eukprot:tig00000459_g1132.t1
MGASQARRAWDESEESAFDHEEGCTCDSCEPGAVSELEAELEAADLDEHGAGATRTAGRTAAELEAAERSEVRILLMLQRTRACCLRVV